MKLTPLKFYTRKATSVIRHFATFHHGIVSGREQSKLIEKLVSIYIFILKVQKEIYMSMCVCVRWGVQHIMTLLIYVRVRMGNFCNLTLL